MYLLDVSCLQSVQPAESAKLVEQIRQLLDELRAENKTVRLLWVLNGVDTLRPRVWLEQLVPDDAYLFFDVDQIAQRWHSELLARFLLAHGVQQWLDLPGGGSVLDRDSIIEATKKAGVGLGETQELNTICAEKPYLAVIAPYPPERSGVADYVEAQLSYLAAHYRLVLVCNDLATDLPSERFPGIVIGEAEFLASAQFHQRVVYHIGNSPAHLLGFRLLRQIPGVVVMHDFFLSDVQQYVDTAIKGMATPAICHLVESHGYQPLLQSMLENGSVDLSAYPCNLHVLERARKVLVHSDYVLRLTQQWYGAPMLRRFSKIGFAKEQMPQQDRVSAKVRLGYAPDDFLVATFGFATPAKSLETIIHAWSTSGLAKEPQAYLLIVGEFLDARYKTRIDRLIKLRQLTNVRQVGYAEYDDYLNYLGAVDLAIQLRVQSRGETSAALLDCMANHVPLIANNHGFVEDIPNDAVWKIAADPDASELAAAIESFYRNPEVGQSQVRHCESQLRAHHNPAQVASALIQHIEACATHAHCATEEMIGAQVAASTLALNERLRLAQALANNARLPYYKQILIDITAIARFDLRTGIQRVVRAILWEMMSDPPMGYHVEPIYLGHDGVYHYARQFVMQTLQLQNVSAVDEPIAVSNGDIYLGIDLHTTSTINHAHIYQDWRQRGVKIINVLYDLLPVRAPQWFPDDVEPDFSAWVKHIALNSDGVIAISKTVADDLAAWVKEQGVAAQRQSPLNIGWFHLGSDLHASVPSLGLPENAPEVLAAISQSPSFLMVSTVEPRKGHAQTLAAFETLWAQGHHYNLVIVGKAGWCVEELTRQLRQHPMAGKTLFWLEGISDEYLEQIYPRCSALLSPSEGEGFGLPLIEAARHNIPVIARDIPVFREVGGEGAYYFKADTPDQLAQAIIDWNVLPAHTRPDPAKIKCLSWRDSARQVLHFMNLDFKDAQSPEMRA